MQVMKIVLDRVIFSIELDVGWASSSIQFITNEDEGGIERTEGISNEATHVELTARGLAGLELRNPFLPFRPFRPFHRPHRQEELSPQEHRQCTPRM